MERKTRSNRSSGGIEREQKRIDNIPDSYNRNADINERIRTRNDGIEDRNRMRSAGMEERSRTRSTGMEERTRIRSAGMEERNRTRGIGMEERNRTRGAGMEERSRTRGIGMEERSRTRSADTEERTRTRSADTGERSRSSRTPEWRKDGRRPRGRVPKRKLKRSYAPKRKRIPPIVWSILSIMAIVLMIFLVFRSCSNTNNTRATSAENIKITSNAMLAGVSLKGLTVEEAKQAIESDMAWNLLIVNGDRTYELPNPFITQIYELLNEVVQVTAKNENKSSDEIDVYELDNEKAMEEIIVAVDDIANDWDVPAKNAGVSAFNKETRKFEFAEGEPGRVIDKIELLSKIETALNSNVYSGMLDTRFDASKPDLQIEEARSRYRIIGTFSTTVSQAAQFAKRNKNIRIASEAIDGQIIERGDVFSINAATGEHTIEKGYEPAGTYVNGVLVEEPGGGVCQVSSTLYNAVIFAGLNTTERYAHSVEPAYVKPGEDAMISYNAHDMKFENNTIDSIGILATLAEGKLTVSIYGIPILEEGVTREMYTEKAGEIPYEGEPEYIEDPTLQPGEEILDKPEEAGTRYITYSVLKQNGVEISREFLHNSRYRGTASVIRRNTGDTSIFDLEIDPITGEPVIGTSESTSNERMPETTRQSETTRRQETTKPPEATTTRAPETTAAPTTQEVTPEPETETTTVQTETNPTESETNADEVGPWMDTQ
jgi:Uncharacterized vancomycin resistance protein